MNADREQMKVGVTGLGESGNSLRKSGWWHKEKWKNTSYKSTQHITICPLTNYKKNKSVATAWTDKDLVLTLTLILELG